MFEEAPTESSSPATAHARTLAQRPSMGIGYLDAADFGGTRLRDSLDILVPTDDANLFATYRVGEGRDRTMFVRAPLVSILPPALPHSLAGRPGPNTLILSIAAPFFDEVAHGLGCGAAALVEPQATADPLIREVGNAVERGVRGRRPPLGGYMESLAAVLAAHVVLNYATAKGAIAAPCGGLAPHKLRCVRKHVREHLGEMIRVDQLAEAVHLSPFHFARMFKRSTGQSPHLYVLLQRIERARELLAGTDMALIDVAAEVGFRTQGHFTSVFHRYAGRTPRTFRLQAREMAAEAQVAGDVAGRQS